MSEPIKVGDLVAVVHWSKCGCGLGAIRSVLSFSSVPPSGCSVCHTPNEGQPEVQAVVVNKRGGKVPIAWVKRIPPLDELEGEKRDEEITV